MTSRNITLWIVIVVVAVGLGAGSGFCLQRTEKEQEIYGSLELFSQALSIIEANYVEEVEAKDLIYGALSGMLSSLGPYSQFLTPDEYKDMQVQTEGEFGGLGIRIAIKNNLLTVITPLHRTPAERAGLQPGDRIIKIDEESTEGITLHESVKKLRGDPGTKITLTIFREKEGKIFDITITRDIIKIESLKGGVFVEDKIGYIKLIELQENTAEEFKQAVLKLKEEKMESLILDLRNNPGGLLDTAVDIADMLIDEEGIIVSTEARDKEKSYPYKGKKKAIIPDEIPIVVLINEGSASGAEIIAGALQDYKRAVLLGTETFGKGSVQTIIPLNDGCALRLTTSKYYLASGRSIHDIGVTPDIIVKKKEIDKSDLEKEPEKIFERLEKEEMPDILEDKEYDYQLNRAIDLIKGLNVYSKRFSRIEN
jgi:carboxyl-terminal processing protease